MIFEKGLIDLNALSKAVFKQLYADERDTNYVNASIRHKIDNCLEKINHKTLWKDKEKAIIDIYMLANALAANNLVDLNKYIDVRLKEDMKEG